MAGIIKFEETINLNLDSYLIFSQADSFVRKLAELLPVSIPEKLPPPIPPNAPPSLRWISMITINTIANRA